MGKVIVIGSGAGRLSSALKTAALYTAIEKYKGYSIITCVGTAKECITHVGVQKIPRRLLPDFQEFVIKPINLHDDD